MNIPTAFCCNSIEFVYYSSRSLISDQLFYVTGSTVNLAAFLFSFDILSTFIVVYSIVCLIANMIHRPLLNYRSIIILISYMQIRLVNVVD